MKIITFAILALLALSFVKTDERSDYLQCRKDNPKINFLCDMNLDDYEACDQVYQAVSECISDCKDEDTFKERAVCIEKKCKSSRKDVQIMIDLELKCHKQVAESEDKKPSSNLREEKASNASNQSLSAKYLIYSLGLIALAMIY
ncbi:hypothetical protein ABPG74_020022 [Tetrahymena malaccensis]